jgi:hypothetical protein
MLKFVDPFPLPLAPPVTVIHAALLAAVHAHPVGVVTAVDPVVALAPADWLDGEIEYVQAAAACVTVNVCPAIVSVPVRCDAAGFGAILNETVPLPEPLVAPTSVNHDALLVAVHAQPVTPVMFVDVDPPAAVAENDVGASENVQGTPACVTVNTTPAIVSDPTRCVVFGFAATLYGTVALPMPLVMPVSVIQELLLTAVHEQPVVAVSATVPVAAADVMLRLVGAIVGGEHAGENENPFDTALGVVPPGPTALTRASNIRPGVGS